MCGVYEQHEPHYVSIAVHRPEWGEFSQKWNIECSNSDVNGYSLIIWYYTAEDRYEIQMDGKNASAKFDYFPVTGQYGEGYPDPDTVRQMFNKAFGPQDEDFHDKPLTHFEQLVQERFGMSIEELYLLPVK